MNALLPKFLDVAVPWVMRHEWAPTGFNTAISRQRAAARQVHSEIYTRRFGKE